MAPTKLGRLRLQAAPAPCTNFSFCALKKLIINFWIIFTFNKLLLTHVLNKNNAFIFCLPIRCYRSRGRLKKAAPAPTNKKSAPL